MTHYRDPASWRARLFDWAHSATDADFEAIGTTRDNVYHLTNPTKGRNLSWDLLVAVERRQAAKGLAPVFLPLLQEIVGARPVAAPGDLALLLINVVKEVGDVASVVSAALADGTVDAAERRAGLQQIAEAKQRLAEMEAALAVGPDGAAIPHRGSIS